MSYSKEAVKIAREKLSDRRMSAIRYAEIRREQIYKQIPRIAEIEQELSEIGAQVSMCILKGEKAGEDAAVLSQRSLALQEEEKNLLLSAGSSPEALLPKYSCAKCSDTGYVELENKTVLCDCYKKLLTDTACELLSAVSPLKLSTFESFRLDSYSDRPDAQGRVPRDRMSKIFNYCRNYADNFSQSAKSILMRGSTGLGKTHLSLAIANEVLRKGYSVVYVSAPDIIHKLEREHFSGNYTGEEDSFKTLMDCDLLIIDDLGTEFKTQFSVSAIYNIFNSRHLSEKPIIMNTNLPFADLEETYSARFTSRVMGCCDDLEFIGADLRA